MNALAAYPRIRFMGSKHRLAPRLAEIFATLPPGPAIDAFSGSGVVAYTLKAGGREVLANDHLAFTADARRGAGGQRGRAAGRPGRGGDLLAQPRRARLHRAHVRRALLPARRPRVPRRAWSHIDELGGREARARAQRAVPRRRPEAAARRLHGHDAALRRRPPAVPDEPRASCSGRRSAAATPPSSRAPPRARLRRRVRARSRRRRDRLPRPAVRPAARRHLLRQALPLPRGPGDVLAGPGDHVGDAHAQAAQAPHAVRVQADGAGPRSTGCSTISARRRRSSSPTAPTPTSTRTSSKRCSPATGGGAADRDPAPLRVRHTRAPRDARVATEYVFVARLTGPGLYSRRCRRW